MKISESRFRKILLEESKRFLSESIMPMEDDGPFEPGDRVVMQRPGRPPETGRVVSRRRVSGISFSRGVMPSDDKYIYDVAFSVGGGRMGSRIERMVPGALLKRADVMDSILSRGLGGSPSGGEADASSGLGEVDFTSFNLRDAASRDDYLNTIDDIKNEIDDGKSVMIKLDPLAAAIMALYSKQYESGANRFILSSDSAADLASFSGGLSDVVQQLMGDSVAKMSGLKKMHEFADPLSVLGYALLGAGAVYIFKLILNYSKSESDSRRQAQNQAQILALAKYSVENGCEVEVTVNSDASTSADDAVDGKVSDTPTGSAKGKSDTKNSSGGTIKVRSCSKK